MAQYFKQERKSLEDDNFEDGLVNGDWPVFTAGKYSIVRLGIQGYPGMYFTLNDGTVNIDSDYISKARLGGTGMFEMDLTDTSSRINAVTINFSDYLPTQWNTPILVDIVYEEKGVNA